MSILLYGCTTWTLTKRTEKKLDSTYIRMLRAILNKSWRQQPTKRQLYGHLPLISKTIQGRRTKHAGHYWRSRDELKSDILQRTLSHGRAKTVRPARTYIQQLCADTECSLEDLPEAMDDREGCRESVRYIRAGGVIWWWWFNTNNSIFLLLIILSERLNSSIWPIDGTLTGTTIVGQSGSGSNGNKEVFHKDPG